MNPKATAVKAWIDWRAALHVAKAPHKPAEQDALSAMLRAWWKEQQLPKLEELTDAHAELVLVKIASLDWSCRPFGEP